MNAFFAQAAAGELVPAVIVVLAINVVFGLVIAVIVSRERRRDLREFHRRRSGSARTGQTTAAPTTPRPRDAWAAAAEERRAS